MTHFAAPIGNPFIKDSNALDYASATAFLSQHRWPLGLQISLLRNIENIPMRFFICDDSQSMTIDDGHRLVGKGAKKQLVESTRWEELRDFVQFHAGLADAAKAKSRFRLLNSGKATTVGRADGGTNYRQLMEYMSKLPKGKTPLCYHITQVICEIRSKCAYIYILLGCIFHNNMSL